MRSFTLAAVSALAASAFAGPLFGRSSSCMTHAEAQKVATNFKDLISLPFNTTLAQTALTVGFTDYSDSVIELIDAGCPNGPLALGTATFTSQAAFIAGQSTQAPITFNIKNLWYNCDTVIIRWRTPAPGSVTPEEIVTGIIVLETVCNPTAGTDEPWLINTVYSEFNSGAWLYDLGNFTPSCAGTKAKRHSLPLRSDFDGRGALL